MRMVREDIYVVVNVSDLEIDMREALRNTLECPVNGSWFREFWLNAETVHGKNMKERFKSDCIAEVRRLLYASFDKLVVEGNRHFLVYDQCRSLKEIDKKTITDYRYYLREKLKMSPNSIGTSLGRIKSFLDYLEIDIKIRIPPRDESRDLDILDEKNIKDNELRLIYRTIEMVLMDNDGSPEYQGALVTWIILDTGMRAKDATTLNIDSLMLSPDGIPSIIWVIEKSTRQNKVSISIPLYQAIQRWLEIRPDVDHLSLFVNQRGDRPKYSWVYHWFKRIGGGYSPHAGRHTSGRKVYEKTKDVVYLSRRLGLKRVETAMKYIKSPDADDVDLYDKVWGSDYLNGQPK